MLEVLAARRAAQVLAERVYQLLLQAGPLWAAVVVEVAVQLEEEEEVLGVHVPVLVVMVVLVLLVVLEVLAAESSFSMLQPPSPIALL